MKLTDILQPDFCSAEWLQKGYELPQYDIAALCKRTAEAPTWVHFGGGNIFRAFPAAMLDKLISNGLYDRGVIVASHRETEVFDKAYDPYRNLTLLVTLCPDGSVRKQVVGSITEALRAYPGHADWERMCAIFRNPSLQMVSFTITEKGYAFTDDDLARGLSPESCMGRVCLLLLERYRAGRLPLTLQSMDNCSHNGDILKRAILAYAEAWAKAGLVETDFVEYLRDEKLVSFPWSMIDKITPRPHGKVQEFLRADGFEDCEQIETSRHTFVAPFVNAEEVEYLVMEDAYPNGRPPLHLGGALYATRQTVDEVETMKVTTCLNPLHTALAIYGCMLGYTLISSEMQDDDLRTLITRMGYEEAMPVVTDPGIIHPGDFIRDVLQKRLPNPFMPDAPQRIAMDTSQKLPIRFGVTLKKYAEPLTPPPFPLKGQGDATPRAGSLTFIPLVLAGYARYLKGIDDKGEPFSPSPDPRLEELMAIIRPLEIGHPDQDWSPLRALFCREDVFGVDLYEIGIGERTEAMARELFSAPGAIRTTLHKYVAGAKLQIKN